MAHIFLPREMDENKCYQMVVILIVLANVKTIRAK
jgi:hypothetical protein